LWIYSELHTGRIVWDINISAIGLNLQQVLSTKFKWIKYNELNTKFFRITKILWHLYTFVHLLELALQMHFATGIFLFLVPKFTNCVHFFTTKILRKNIISAPKILRTKMRVKFKCFLIVKNIPHQSQHSRVVCSI